MNEEFGSLLRTLRHNRGLSREQLAIRAGVAVRTLGNWETGRHSPSGVEIDSVLRTLQVTPSEKARAVDLLTTRRGVHMARREAVAQSSLAPDLGPLPNLGDLLQAMRMRARFTQEQLAACMGVTRTTVMRWETTRNLPTAESLDRLCTLLHAAPEEKQALQARRLQRMHWKPFLSLEECMEQRYLMEPYLTNVSFPLMDLHMLALKRHLWLLAGQSTEAVRLLAGLETARAGWLFTESRMAESEEAVWRALNLARRHLTPEPFWLWALNLATVHYVEKARSREAGIALMQRWLPVLPRNLQFTLWCDMALHAGCAGMQEESGRFFREAQDTLENVSGQSAHDHSYYRATQAGMLLEIKQPIEAMNWLPEVNGETDYQISMLLLWGEALVAAGDTYTAQRTLNRAQTLLTEYPQPKKQTRLDRLLARLA